MEVLVVCGPTASGKSSLADDLTEIGGFASSAILVDSMQVYREIPCITNQARRREARLSGVISVKQDWSVADHCSAVRREMERDAERGDISILDAGTGMYLNAAILDVPLAPSVPQDIREKAIEATLTAENPRRAAREKELELAGEEKRTSIWDGDPTFKTKILYIRPEISALETSIKERSRTILDSGLSEARRLFTSIETGVRINPSVLDSIGVRELLKLVSGEISTLEAEERLNIRTRRLAKRQIRWFDKLIKSLPENVGVRLLDSPDKNSMHDIIRLWNLL